MTENELLHGYVRVRVTAARIFIEVKTNHEDGEVLAARWSLAAALPARSTPLEVARIRMMTLADYRYFRVCDTCGDRHPSSDVRSRADGTDVCRECDD